MRAQIDHVLPWLASAVLTQSEKPSAIRKRSLWIMVRSSLIALGFSLWVSTAEANHGSTWLASAVLTQSEKPSAIRKRSLWIMVRSSLGYARSAAPFLARWEACLSIVA